MLSIIVISISLIVILFLTKDLLIKVIKCIYRALINVFIVLYKIVTLPFLLIKILIIKNVKRVYSKEYRKLNWKEYNHINKYKFSKFEDTTRSSKWMTESYASDLLSLRERLQNRVSTFIVTLKMVFEIEYWPQEEFVEKDINKVVRDSDKELKELKYLTIISKNPFVTFLKLNNISYKQKYNKKPLDIVNILLFGISMLCIAFGIFIAAAIITLISISLIGEKLRLKNKHIEIDDKGFKKIKTLINNDITKMAEINDSVLGIIRRNEYLTNEIEFKKFYKTYKNSTLGQKVSI